MEIGVGIFLTLIAWFISDLRIEARKTNELLEQIRDDQRITGRNLEKALKDINSNTSIG